MFLSYWRPILWFDLTDSANVSAITPTPVVPGHRSRGLQNHQSNASVPQIESHLTDMVVDEKVASRDLKFLASSPSPATVVFHLGTA
jgi:hypothetical protein